MTPTRWPSLVGLVVFAGVVGWLFADRAYGDLVALPAYAAVTAALIAVFELALARIVWRKVRHVGSSKPMHPLQVARAAVLAKASSTTGALLAGFYGGFCVWAAPQSENPHKAHDAWVSAWSALACLALLAAALLLEKACRTPKPRDEMPA